jgi:hypothetical protein
MISFITCNSTILIVSFAGVIVACLAFRIGVRSGGKKGNVSIQQEALEKWLGVGTESLSSQLYTLVANIRVSGSRDYHSLTNVYLTACSITIAAVGLTLKDGSIVSYFISGLFSLLGLFICLQMSIAQARFRSDNHYWERLLRRAEAADGWEGPKIFTRLHAFREYPEIVGETGAADGMIANFGVRWHRSWWGARMKALPLVFAVVFILTLITSIVLGVKGLSG